LEKNRNWIILEWFSEFYYHYILRRN